MTFEYMLGIETDEDNTATMSPRDSSLGSHSLVLKRTFTVVERVMFTLLSVAVSILVPEFSSMMAFLGSFSAFVMCIIGPVAAKVALEGYCCWFDAALLVVATVMATWGTVGAFCV